MKDTRPDVEAKYRAMLLARSGEARLEMAGSMYATARALVEASVLATDPSVSAAALRQAVFLRFYGSEFDAKTRERILDRLAVDARAIDEPAGPGRRRVAIDWDELEIALTSQMDEMTSFLDLRTGKVRWCWRSGFADQRADGDLSEEEADDGLAEGHLLRIEPFSSSLEWSWMAQFASSVADVRVRDRLDAALRGRSPFRRFKHVLAAHPRDRGRWFRFHDTRVREAMREWVKEQGIEPTTSPRDDVGPGAQRHTEHS